MSGVALEFAKLVGRLEGRIECIVTSRDELKVENERLVAEVARLTLERDQLEKGRHSQNDRYKAMEEARDEARAEVERLREALTGPDAEYLLPVAEPNP